MFSFYGLLDIIREVAGCLQVCLQVCVQVCLQVCTGVCTGVCAGVCAGVCTGVCTGVSVCVALTETLDSQVPAVDVSCDSCSAITLFCLNVRAVVKTTADVAVVTVFTRLYEVSAL